MKEVNKMLQSMRNSAHSSEMTHAEFSKHIQGTLMTLGELRIRRKTAEVAKAPVDYGTFFR